MRKINRLLSVLLAFMLVLQPFAGAVSAKEGEVHPIEPVIKSAVNPLYEGLVSEEVLRQQPESAAMLIDEVSYSTTIQGAGYQLQDGMQERKSTIAVGYQTNEYSDDIAQELFDSIFAAAFVHTGGATEGDYLRWQWAGWNGQLGGYEQDGIYYLTFTYNVSYYTTAQQEAELTQAIRTLLNSLGLSGKTDYEKVRAVYDYICANVTYDYANLNDENYTRKFTAYAAMMDKTAVCQGYALLFYRLALELGIDARLIAGIGGGGAHGWNIVELNDLYYNLDSTWDAGLSNYYWFLKSDANFSDHARYDEYTTASFCKAYPMGSSDYVPHAVNPGESQEEDWEYTADNGAAVITKYVGSDADVVIPSELGGCPVTALSNTVFSDNTTIKSVSFPASVERIMDGWIDLGSYPYVSYGTFAGCTNLTSVHIPEDSRLNYIGEWAFFGCSSLSNVSLPESIRILALSCFEDCTALTSITLPEGLQEIRQNAFSGSGIRNLDLPSTCSVFNWANTMPKLEAITVAEGNPTYRSHEGVLYQFGPPAGTGEGWTLSVYPINKPEETYRVPDYCQSIFGDGFATSYSVTYLKELYIGDSVGVTGVVGGDSIARIPSEVIPDSTNSYYRIERGVLLSKDGKTLVQVPHSVKGELIIPKTVEKLEPYLFWYNEELDSVRFTGNAPEINESTFGFVNYTAYYPANNPTYTTDYLNNNREFWHGSLTWMPYGCDSHTYEADVVAPSCEEEGYTIHTCSACGDSYVDSYVDALGHDMSQWATTKEATCTETGSKRKDCSRCDYSETEEIAATGHDYMKGTCTRCGEEDANYTNLEGMNCVDGVWGYYTDGELDTDYTNLVYYNDIFYYVENGLINWDYVGLAQHKETEVWYYVQGGGVDRSFTGLTMYNGRWFYLEAGSITWSYTGLVEFEGNWYYVQYSQLNFDYTGLVLHGDVWYYVQDSVLSWGQYTLVNHGGTWYYVQNSMLQWGYYGLVNYNGVWYYLENSQITWNFTDLVLYNDVWYYVKGSTIAWDYTGVVPYGGGMFYVENGTINWGYYGSFTQDGVTYEIANGTVVG